MTTKPYERCCKDGKAIDADDWWENGRPGKNIGHLLRYWWRSARYRGGQAAGRVSDVLREYGDDWMRRCPSVLWFAKTDFALPPSNKNADTA